MEQDQSALYVSWLLAAPGIRSVRAARRRLERGEEHDLYRLRSWVIANGEARALLTPGAPLESVLTGLWGSAAQPLETRWVARRAEYERLKRDIEQMPVALGLTESPDEWPHSSAAAG